MNLQPVYPSRTSSGSTLTLWCKNHARMVADSGTAFADLDDKPGTYYCAQCTSSLLLRHSVMVDALVARDQRERRHEVGRYALAGRIAV